MAIRFACKCGRRLKAREEMAGRGSVCPSCHAFVCIPSLRPTHRETPPSTATDRSRELRCRSARCSDSNDKDRREVALKNPVTSNRRTGAVDGTTRTRRAERRSARHRNAAPVRITLRSRPRWAQFLSEPRGYYRLYPNLYLAIPRSVRLGGILALLTSLIVVAWPHLSASSREDWSVALFVSCLLLLLYALGDAISRIDSVLSEAVNGKEQLVSDVEPQLSRALVSCARWLGCFLAGPTLLVGSAIGFWLYCGELTAIDWLILAELSVAAGAWWAMSLVTSHDVPDRLVLTPLRAIGVACSMSPSGLGLTLLTAGLFFGHALIALFSISVFHEVVLWGLLLLAVCWSSGLHFAEVVIRRLGLAYNHMQHQSPNEYPDPS